MSHLFIIILFWTCGTQANDTINKMNDTILPSADSLKVIENIDFLYDRLLEEAETVLEESDEEAMTEDYEELLDEYERLRDQPVNINGHDLVRLAELGLLNGFQIEALRQYQRQFGDLLFTEELMMVDGFDERCLAVLEPIICFGKNEVAKEMEKVTLDKAITRGRHTITLNYAQKFDGTASEEPPSDSMILARPNAYPLGDPMKWQLKYSYQYGPRLRLGFAMEKDAGEPMFFGHLGDTLQALVHNYRKPGFDFYGAFLYLTEVPLSRSPREHPVMLQSLALGDYQLSFGQGLTLWSGMSFGKASGGSSVMKRAAGIRPKASAGEGKFFRGAAMTLTYRDFQATAFYSLRHIDATTIEGDTLTDDDEPALVSALQESGYHRTLGELAKRHNLRQQVFGGHLSYSGPQLEIGYTLYHVRLNKTLLLSPTKYNQFYFQGDRLTDMGLDFRWQLPKAALFGELSRSDNGAFAGLAGVTVKPTGYIDFTFFYRNYDTRYQNLFFGAVKEISRGQAEEGYYLGLQCAPAPRWSLLLHCDLFRLKWLTSQVYNPSWGQEYQLKILHQVNSNVTMQLRLKSKTKMKNSTDGEVFSHYPIFYTKRSVQFQVSYTLFDGLLISHKAAYAHYFNEDGSDSQGYLVCQDIAYKPEGKPYALTFRYALFDNDDYNSRINLYENDVLGAFSIPSLNGLGTRVYLLARVKLFNSLSLYSRIGFNFLQEDTKTDLKAEVIWKF